jgi:vacuolar-type H+-ATPase subunit H
MAEQDQDGVIAAHIHDAEASLDRMIGWFEPVLEMRKNVRATVEQALADAQAKAEGILEAAKADAERIAGEIAAKLQEHREAMVAALEKREALTKAVDELTGQHGDLAAKVEAAKAHLDSINGEISATLTKFVGGAVKAAIASPAAPAPAAEAKAE